MQLHDPCTSVTPDSLLKANFILEWSYLHKRGEYMLRISVVFDRTIFTLVRMSSVSTLKQKHIHLYDIIKSASILTLGIERR